MNKDLVIATQLNAQDADRAVVRVVMVDILEPRARELLTTQLPDPDWRFETPVDGTPQALATLVKGAAALITRRRFVSEELITASGSEGVALVLRRRQVRAARGLMDSALVRGGR